MKTNTVYKRYLNPMDARVLSLAFAREEEEIDFDWAMTEARKLLPPRKGFRGPKRQARLKQKAKTIRSQRKKKGAAATTPKLEQKIRSVKEKREKSRPDRKTRLKNNLANASTRIKSDERNIKVLTDKLQKPGSLGGPIADRLRGRIERFKKSKSRNESIVQGLKRKLKPEQMQKDIKHEIAVAKSKLKNIEENLGRTREAYGSFRHPENIKKLKSKEDKFGAETKGVEKKLKKLEKELKSTALTTIPQPKSTALTTIEPSGSTALAEMPSGGMTTTRKDEGPGAGAKQPKLGIMNNFTPSQIKENVAAYKAGKKPVHTYKLSDEEFKGVTRGLREHPTFKNMSTKDKFEAARQFSIALDMNGFLVQ